MLPVGAFRHRLVVCGKPQKDLPDLLVTHVLAQAAHLFGPLPPPLRVCQVYLHDVPP